MSDHDAENNALEMMSATINSLNKSWHILRQTDKTWNIKCAQQNTEKLRPLIAELTDQWQAADSLLSELMTGIKGRLKAPVYPEELEQELKAAGVQFSGDFPQYFLPPFKLVVSADAFEARLSIGRKIERTTELNPKQLAGWVAVRYKKVLSRRFNAQAFMKDLIEAYRYASRLNFCEKEMIWGRAVPIMDIYDMLTIRHLSRQDYPRQFFTYDLGLLKESASMELDRYRFELGFPRNQSRAIIVVDSSGRESRISSLTIYLDEGGL